MKKKYTKIELSLKKS